MSSPKDTYDPGRVKSGTPKGGREGGRNGGRDRRKGGRKKTSNFLNTANAFNVNHNSTETLLHGATTTKTVQTSLKI